MSNRASEKGKTPALVLVGLMLLAIPAGLTVAQGLSTTDADQSTIPTITPPPLISPTPTETPTEMATPTPTSTPTPTPDGDDNNTDGDGTNEETYFVNAGVGPADSVTSDEGCSGANYSTIQGAVDTAEPGDTVAVCPGTYNEHVEVTTANLTLTVADRVARAAGDVTITNANESAVWINAPDVTLQGFNIRVGEGADFAIEVGGKKAIIRGNTVKSPLVGIFLSDGHTDTGECRVNNRTSKGQYMCDGGPPVDPDLGAANGGRVLNNTVEASMLRIWVDADQTVVQNNFVTGRNPEDPPNYPECRTNNVFDPCKSRFNDSIVSSGNDTIIQSNTVRIDKQPTGLFHKRAGILIGKTPTVGHNMATNNTVVANTIRNPIGIGIKARNVTAGSTIRNNSIREAGLVGVQVTDKATISGNDITCGGGIGIGIRIMGFAFAEVHNYQNKEAFVINNTIVSNRCGIGINVRWKSVIKRNTIHVKGLPGTGVKFGVCRGGSGRLVNNKVTDIKGKGDFNGVAVRIAGDDYKVPCPSDLKNGQIKILNNTITNNDYGFIIQERKDPDRGEPNPRRIEIHDNLINNNNELGIWNRNESVIVDATNNIWACGGPSGGANPLADPYTGRLANGSGDLISAGNGSTRNGHHISNVHFDPFKVLASCPESGSTPTPTPSPTPTPTPTSTDTPTPTPTPMAVDDIGNGTGGTGGSGTGGASGNGTGGTGSGGVTTDTNRPSEGTSSTVTPPTPTETPPETPTLSPTPQVEPGFGVGAWALAVAILVSLVVLRRRESPLMMERND